MSGIGSNQGRYKRRELLKKQTASRDELKTIKLAAVDENCQNFGHF